MTARAKGRLEMAGTDSYAVTDLVIREAPLLDSSGQVKSTTTATFMVGAHGPFTLSWPGMTPKASDIVTAIQNKVAEIKQLGAAVSQLNARG